MRRAETATLTWADYRAEFPIFESTTYLNTCSLAPLSRRVAAAVGEYLRLWQQFGASAWYGPWWEEIATLRRRVAQVIGADPSEVALFPHVTAAIVAAASAVDFRTRPRVVCSELEFPTTRYLWQTKTGVAAVTLDSPGGVTVPLGGYDRAVHDRTALVVGSHVYFTSGMVQDITALARLAHARGASCLIDAYQSVGQLPRDWPVLGGVCTHSPLGSGAAFGRERLDVRADEGEVEDCPADGARRAPGVEIPGGSRRGQGHGPLRHHGRHRVRHLRHPAARAGPPDRQGSRAGAAVVGLRRPRGAHPGFPGVS